MKLLKQEIVGFPTTSMMRNLLVVHVSQSLCPAAACVSAKQKKKKKITEKAGLALLKHMNCVAFDASKIKLLSYCPRFVFQSYNFWKRTGSLLFSYKSFFSNLKLVLTGTLSFSNLLCDYFLSLNFVSWCGK